MFCFTLRTNLWRIKIIIIQGSSVKTTTSYITFFKRKYYYYENMATKKKFHFRITKNIFRSFTSVLKKELYEWGGESLNASSSAMGTLSNFENTKDGRKICTLCGMTFSTMANAQRHFRNQHTSTERIHCQIANCQKNFKNNHSYTEHLRISHGTSKSMLNIS